MGCGSSSTSHPQQSSSQQQIGRLTNDVHLPFSPEDNSFIAAGVDANGVPISQSAGVFSINAHGAAAATGQAGVSSKPQSLISPQLSLRNPGAAAGAAGATVAGEQGHSQHESNNQQNHLSYKHQSSDVLSHSVRGGVISTTIKQILIIPPYDSDGNLQDEIQKVEIKSDVQTNLKRQQLQAEKQRKQLELQQQQLQQSNSQQGPSGVATTANQLIQQGQSNQNNNNNAAGTTKIANNSRQNKPISAGAVEGSRAVSEMRDFIVESNLLSQLKHLTYDSQQSSNSGGGSPNSANYFGEDSPLESTNSLFHNKNNNNNFPQLNNGALNYNNKQHQDTSATETNFNQNYDYLSHQQQLQRPSNNSALNFSHHTTDDINESKMIYSTGDTNLLSRLDQLSGKNSKMPSSNHQQAANDLYSNFVYAEDYEYMETDTDLDSGNGQGVNLLDWVKSKRPPEQQEHFSSESPIKQFQQQHLPLYSTAAVVGQKKTSIMISPSSNNLIPETRVAVAAKLQTNSNNNQTSIMLISNQQQQQQHAQGGVTVAATLPSQTQQHRFSASSQASPNSQELHRKSLPQENSPAHGLNALQLPPFSNLEKYSRKNEINRKNTFDTFNDTISNASPINQTSVANVKQSNQQQFNFHTLFEGISKQNGLSISGIRTGANIHKQESAMTDELESIMRGIDDKQLQSQQSNISQQQLSSPQQVKSQQSQEQQLMQLKSEQLPTKINSNEKQPFGTKNSQQNQKVFSQQSSSSLQNGGKMESQQLQQQQDYSENQSQLPSQPPQLSSQRLFQKLKKVDSVQVGITPEGIVENNVGGVNTNPQPATNNNKQMETSFAENNLICEFERHDSRDDQFQISVLSPRKNNQSRVLHTTSLQKDINEDGKKVINNYTLVKELGRGNCGKVKLAVDDSVGKFFAIKIANKNKLKQKLISMKTSAFTLLEKEIAIMKKIDHPNIVKLQEVIEDNEDDKLYIVMDFMRRGAILSSTYFSQSLRVTDPERFASLYDENGKIKSTAEEPKTISIKSALKYMRQMALALDYMHNFAQIVHRDIKPDNLLVDENDNLKVADFGISQIMEETDETSTNAGTKAFMSPESWEKKVFKATPLDIWATGVTLYFMIYGMAPFREKKMIDLKNEICTKEVVLQSEPVLPALMKDFLMKMLEKDPEKRLTAKEMLTHPWLTNNGEIILRNVIDHTLEVNDKDIEKAIGKSTKFQASIMIAVGVKRALRRARNSMNVSTTSHPSTPGSAKNNIANKAAVNPPGKFLLHQATSPFLTTSQNTIPVHRNSDFMVGMHRSDNVSKFSSQKLPKDRDDDEEEDDDDDEQLDQSRNFDVSNILKNEEL